MILAEPRVRGSLALLCTLVAGTAVAAALDHVGDELRRARDDARYRLRASQRCTFFPTDASTDAPTRVAPVRPEVTGNDYATVVRGRRDELSACVSRHEQDIRLEVTIGPEGRVRGWQALVETGDFDGMDGAAMRCVQDVLDPLRFPTATEPVMLSTYLVGRSGPGPAVGPL